MKNIEKEAKSLAWLMVILVVIFLVATILISHYEKLKRDYGCYIFHVQECLYCQKQNLTYLLCSGFCVKPSPQDLDGKGCPVIHPTKNCFDLPKECNL